MAADLSAFWAEFARIAPRRVRMSPDAIAEISALVDRLGDLD
jgi:hypothetical protein